MRECGEHIILSIINLVRKNDMVLERLKNVRRTICIIHFISKIHIELLLLLKRESIVFFLSNVTGVFTDYINYL